VLKEPEVHKVVRAVKVKQVHKELKAPQVPKEMVVLRVFKERLVHKDKEDLKGFREPQVQLVL